MKSNDTANKSATSTAVVTEEQKLPTDDPMFVVAMLKVAIEMKKGRLAEFEEIIDGVVEDLDLDADRFRKFVNRHMKTLMAHVRSRGY